MKHLNLICLLFVLVCSNLFSKELKDNPLVHYTGLNFGSTTIFEDYTSAHIGLNYELKKYEGKYGIGMDFDYMFGPYTEILIAFPLTFHKVFGTDGLVLSAAPGIGISSSVNYLISENKDTPQDDKFLDRQTRPNLLLRGTIAWEFPIRNETEEFMAITPYLKIDYIADIKTYLSFGVKTNFFIY